MATVLTDIARGIATITLNRPEVHNAFDERMIAELAAALDAVAGRPELRVVQLAAAGASFSAGADLDWMRRMAGSSEEENRADAERLARLLHRLATLPKPTVALVQGAAYGGGVGLIAACDVALVAEGARFGLTEVRLGLVPAVISPYVIGSVGARWARRLFLTGERFDAELALRIGLVHEVLPADRLASRAAELAALLEEGAPKAQAEAKALVAQVSGEAADEFLIDHTSALIARLRAAPEGREGVAAFLEKRKPSWRR
ncbi:MAG: enoyl-CoA hydratase-related protein [Rhodospirillales bacterium]|nr:enoyl-CoA hydratase-related protein [Rhodospirillales bacterium]